MKDLSQYHYSELYDMLNHINPFKHPDRIEAVEHEITLRKHNGEVPDRLIPEINLTKEDKVLFLQMIAAGILRVVLAAIAFFFLQPALEGEPFSGKLDNFSAFLSLIVFFGLIIDFFRSKRRKVQIFLILLCFVLIMTYGITNDFSDLLELLPF
jgi:hypothetical protein